MRKLVFLFLILVVVITGCDHHSTYQRLVSIDSLLMNGNFDSASIALEYIRPMEMDEKEYAYYCLLEVITNYNLDGNYKMDSVIDLSIAYYKKHNEKGNLARAYYQKGVMQDEYNNIDEAFRYLKMAELLTDDVDNLKLRHDIYLFLCYLNNVAGNLNVAIGYAHKALQLSNALSSKRLLGADYLQLSSSYHNMKMQDSSDFYIDKLIPYLKYQPERDLPDMMNNIAVSYFNRYDTATAKEYLQKSLAIKPQEHTYFLLAEIYSAEGDDKGATHLWEKALQAPELYMREGITRMYAEWLKRHGQYKKATEMISVADSLKGVLGKKNMGETILTLQNEYDREYLVDKAKTRIRTIGIVVAVLVCGIMGIWIFYHQRSKRVHSLMQTTHHMTSQMKEQIERLEEKREEREKHIESLQYHLQRMLRETEQLKLEGEKNSKKTSELEKMVKAKAKQIRLMESIHEQKSKELKALQAKMRKSAAEQDDIMSKGYERYVELMNDGKASQWNKTDAINFLAYFNSVKPEIIKEVHRNYEGLSPNHEVIALLMAMGKSDEDLKSIFGLSAGALRTAKSRINAKRKRLL